MKPFEISQHTDQQGFLNMFQQVGESMGLMPLQSADLDDYVPLGVVHTWARGFIAAYSNLFLISSRSISAKKFASKGSEQAWSHKAKVVLQEHFDVACGSQISPTGR